MDYEQKDKTDYKREGRTSVGKGGGSEVAGPSSVFLGAFLPESTNTHDTYNSVQSSLLCKPMRSVAMTCGMRGQIPLGGFVSSAESQSPSPARVKDVGERQKDAMIERPGQRFCYDLELRPLRDKRTEMSRGLE